MFVLNVFLLFTAIAKARCEAAHRAGRERPQELVKKIEEQPLPRGRGSVSNTKVPVPSRKRFFAFFNKLLGAAKTFRILRRR